ncbi:transglutaminase family protein [Maribius pontilimi]|uniref:Transglutaminase family protein n=1 Tax=Palleronia pontilimi TaxID=1964209 RepID=A0A934IDU8_9RHOB|nr:transglutaminase family protein [Palleronia pontilimi]MBJ3763821.1 transglutaminase family protein [Palleronia pontilimi]
MPDLLRIVHRTEYRYDRVVQFGPHRLMLRPRDAHDLWVEDASLSIYPPAQLRWKFDPFGNSVASASFTDPADRLSVTSTLLLRRYSTENRRGGLGSSTAPFPFEYSADEKVDLRPFRRMHDPEDETIISGWIDRVFPGRPATALAFLSDLATAIHGAISYSRRDEMGTQTAAETIRTGRGTCRDFAFLFMETARSFGFAARFVTGYLHDARAESRGMVGGGATHAWADVYVPDEGWIEFDPTNRIVGGAPLIRVATTRTPRQASPISGSFVGRGAALRGLDVVVDVTSEHVRD